MKTITISGSAAFYSEMQEVVSLLNNAGFEVNAPLDKKADLNALEGEEFIDFKNELMSRYFTFIKNSDALLVANYTKDGKENYIGSNTLIEMAIAMHENVQIFMLNPIPEQPNTDEIIAMKPIVTDGNLDKMIKELQ